MIKSKSFYNLLKKAMSKDKENLQPMQMFSKIGRYISQRIVRVDHRKSRQPRRRSPQVVPLHKEEPVSAAPAPKQALTNRHANQSQEFQPCVGHYQVRFSVIDKNLPRVNFKKLLPHFSQDRHVVHQSSPVVKDYPEGILNRVRGFQELHRMTSREQIKGCVRKTGENPHENRFESPHDADFWTEDKKTVDFSRMLKRNNLLFKSLQFSPDYNPNTEFSKKVLATHLVEFEKQLPRGEEFVLSKTGKSEQFQEGSLPRVRDRTVQFDKMLPRSHQPELPSYLDKGINNRMSLSTFNWRALQMNCHENSTLNSTSQ